MSDRPIVSNDAAEQIVPPQSPADSIGVLKDQIVDSSKQIHAAALETVDSLRSEVGHKAKQIKVEALRNAKKIQSTAEDQWSKGRDSAKQLQSEAETYIRSNPIKAVLGGFGVGLIIGLLRRR